MEPEVLSPTRTAPGRRPWCGPAARCSWSIAGVACCSARRRLAWAPPDCRRCCSPTCTATTSPNSATCSSPVGSATSRPIRRRCRSSGRPGTAETVEATLKAFGHDIGYRIAHHADLNAPPPIEVHECTEGTVWDRDGVTIRVAPTDHRPVAPTIGFRIESDGSSVVLAGDTVPCASLDELAGRGGRAGTHRDPQGHRHAGPTATSQGHLRLPLVGGAGGRHRGARRGGHAGHDALCAGHRARAGGAVAGAGRIRVQRARSSSATTYTASRSRRGQ